MNKFSNENLVKGIANPTKTFIHLSVMRFQTTNSWTCSHSVHCKTCSRCFKGLRWWTGKHLCLSLFNKVADLQALWSLWNCGASKYFMKALRIFGNSPACYMFKVNNRNTRTRCEICSELTIKKPERSHWRRSGFFIVNSEHISYLVLVFLLLNLSR